MSSLQSDLYIRDTEYAHFSRFLQLLSRILLIKKYLAGRVRASVWRCINRDVYCTLAQYVGSPVQALLQRQPLLKCKKDLEISLHILSSTYFVGIDEIQHGAFYNKMRDSWQIYETVSVNKWNNKTKERTCGLLCQNRNICRNQVLQTENIHLGLWAPGCNNMLPNMFNKRYEHTQIYYDYFLSLEVLLSAEKCEQSHTKVDALGQVMGVEVERDWRCSY